MRPNEHGDLLDLRPDGIDGRFAPALGVLLNLNILSYELGRLTHGLVYGFSASYNVEDEKLARGHVAFAYSEWADMITQLRVLGERMGWDWWQGTNDGLERYKERMGELARREV